MARGLAGLIAAAALLLSATAAPAATFTATTTADSAVGDASCTLGACTLRQALTAANANPGDDIVELPAGTYALANGQLTSTDGLNLQRRGAGTVTIDAGGLSRVLRLEAPASLSHLTITGGRVTDPVLAEGAGIWSDSRVALDDVVVDNNDAVATGNGDARGGGMWIDEQLSLGGGPASATFSNNTATARQIGDASGGGLALGPSGSGDMLGLRVRNNYVETEDGLAAGAGISSAGTGLQRFSGYIGLNIARATGAGTYPGATGPGEAIGGGLWADGGGTVAVNDTFVESNWADAYSGAATGGGVAISGTATLARSTFYINQAQSRSTGAGVAATGGGATVIGPATVTNSTFSDNQAIAAGTNTAQGGGLGTLGGTATILATTIASNPADAATAANGRGGGVFLGGTGSLSGSILSGNTQGTGRDCDGATLTSAGGNVVYTGAGCGFTTGTDDARVDDPELRLMNDYGGPTQTRVPLGSSPALGRYAPVDGACRLLTIDQRGVPRPQRGTCDAGAIAARPAVFDLFASPSSLAFGSITVGSPSPIQTISIINDGDLPGTPTVAVAGADAGEFTATPCTAAVDPFFWCDVDVTFAPTTAGPASASLTGASTPVALSGTGVGGPPPTPPTGRGGGLSRCRDLVAATDYATAVAVKLDCSAPVWHWAIAQAPQHGTLSPITNTGEIGYVPDAGFSGDDTFQYVAENGGGQSAPAKVVVHVGPGPASASKSTSTARMCIPYRVRIRLNPHGVRFIRARVSVDGARVRPIHHGTRWTAGFELKGRPGQKVSVTVRGRRDDGRLLTRTRALTVC
jgi:hypothetical protein